MIIFNNEQTLWKFHLKGKHKQHFPLRGPMSSLGLVTEMGEDFMDRSMDDPKATALEDQYPAKTMALSTTV